MSDFYGRAIIVNSHKHQTFSDLLESYKDQIFNLLNFQDFLDDLEDNDENQDNQFDSLFEVWKKNAFYTIFDPEYKDIKFTNPGEKFIFFFSFNSAGWWEGFDIVPLEDVSDIYGVSHKFKFMISTPS